MLVAAGNKFLNHTYIIKFLNCGLFFLQRQQEHRMRDNVGIMDCELQIACKTDTSTSVSLLGVVHCCESRGKLPFLCNRVFSYTGCNRRNVQDFGRLFLRSNYTDITQNTYIQSWTVTEIMAIEICGLLWCWHTVRSPWCHTCPVKTCR
jgi:hypothetical protein